MLLYNPNVTQLNKFIGSATQQATSVTTQTNANCYELEGGCYSVYGFEVSRLLRIFNLNPFLFRYESKCSINLVSRVHRSYQ